MFSASPNKLYLVYHPATKHSYKLGLKKLAAYLRNGQDSRHRSQMAATLAYLVTNYSGKMSGKWDRWQKHRINENLERPVWSPLECPFLTGAIRKQSTKIQKRKI